MKTNNQAKKFFKEEWNDKKFEVHSRCVIEACLNMSKGTNLKPTVFVIAGWIHDIGRKDDKDTHHKIGVKYLERFLKQHPEYEELRTEIKDCILHHRTMGKPKTVYGLVFKAADKVALHHKKWLAIK